MADTINNHKRTKVWRCPECNSKYSSLNLLMKHVEKLHKSVISDDVTVKQWIFNRRNGKPDTPPYQLCVICKKNGTKWNEENGRYERFCSDACRKEAGKRAEDNLKKKTGKTRKERMADPEVQKEMLKNRKISGEYTFRDGKTKIGYVGTYELDFLEFYDKELKGNPLDLIECPFNFEYIYDGKKHLYLPDFYIPTLNLIIEIKDGSESNNTNGAMAETTFAKEKFKDLAVISTGKFNFIKIRDKNYDDFIDLIQIIQERNVSGEEFDPIIVNPDR